MNFNKWLELSFLAIIVYLVLVNARGASQLLSSFGRTYVGSIKAFQGRS